MTPGPVLLSIALAFLSVSPINIDALIDGAVEPEVFDFAAIRFADDGRERLNEIEGRAFFMLPEEIRRQSFSPVDVDCRWTAIHEGVEAARLSPDRAAYQAATEAALIHVTAAEQQAEAVKMDASLTPLGEAAALDRVWTALWYTTPRGTPAERLAFERMESLAARSRCEARQAALAALDALIANDGWPDERLPQLAADVTQTVQHAGRRTDLREAALDWAARGLADGGAPAARRYALVADRLSIVETGAQLYGTQGQCAEGRWVPARIQNRADADAWREARGLPDLAAHVEAMHAACG